MSERRKSSSVNGKEEKMKMVKLRGPSCSSDAIDVKNGSEIHFKPLKKRDSFRELQCDDDKSSNCVMPISNSRTKKGAQTPKTAVYSTSPLAPKKNTQNFGCSSGSTSIASSIHEQCYSGTLPKWSHKRKRRKRGRSPSSIRKLPYQPCSSVKTSRVKPSQPSSSTKTSKPEPSQSDAVRKKVRNIIEDEKQGDGLQKLKRICKGKGFEIEDEKPVPGQTKTIRLFGDDIDGKCKNAHDFENGNCQKQGGQPKKS